MMLSVPPEVTTPHTSSPASAETWALPSMVPVIATISASYLVIRGHRSECSGLVWELRA